MADRPRASVEVRLDATSGLDQETEVALDHGHVAIAAITSCTNTSNPQVMVAAGLRGPEGGRARAHPSPVGQDLAGARARRSSSTTSTGPGSSPTWPSSGFDVVGFGCTTCIGNSGPLPPPIAQAAEEHGLALVSVLSGNRNFEGRINPDVRMNYLASPPLVVAYALAGTMDLDLTTEPLATDADGAEVYLRDLWPTSAEVNAIVEDALESSMFRAAYGEVFDGDELWRSLPVRRGRGLRVVRHLHLRAPPALLRRDARRSRPRSPTSRAPGPWRCWATASRPTTSPPPAPSGPTALPAGG